MPFQFSGETKHEAVQSIGAKLRIPASGQAECTGWDEAMEYFSADAWLFLSPDFVAETAQAVGLTRAMIQTLTTFAASIAEDETVVKFFWYCHYRVLNDATLVQSWEEPWPDLDDYLGVDAGLINVLVMLSAVPEMLKTYRRIGIPDPIRLDTVSDLSLWMETDVYYHRYRRWGITPWIARWLCKHWQGKLLQLGRLQFSLSTFDGRLHAYRGHETGQVIALAEEGIRYQYNGDIWGTCCGESRRCWTSQFESTDQIVSGNPICPDGVARRQPVKLSLAGWTLALSRGDAMLTFHVPAGKPLDFDDCGQSFCQALNVFPRYFPDFDFRGFCTSSWLLDPRLQTLLPPTANIARMQREMYVYPGLQGDNQQIFHRVFGWGVTDIHTVPWTTALQKAVGRYLDEGGHFHGGYCFLLREDFCWGNQVYRKHFGSQADTSQRDHLTKLVREKDDPSR